MHEAGKEKTFESMGGLERRIRNLVVEKTLSFELTDDGYVGLNG